MESTTFLALSKQVAIEMRLANLANNLANASTPGFKRMDMSFESFLRRQDATGPILYPVERPARTDLASGPLVVTGNQLDLAVTRNDRAFFLVQRGDERLVTRAGAMQVDAERRIVTASGDPILGADEAPIVLPGRSADVNVTEGGAIYEGAELVGQLAVVEVSAGATLDPQGGNLLRASRTEPAEQFTVKQGVIEQSNVQAVIELTRLIQLSRDFEALQQVSSSEHARLVDVIDRIPAV
jgi:flagellar basal-body rod protein FlgF